MYKVIEEKDDKGKVWYVVDGERFSDRESAQKKADELNELAHQRGLISNKSNSQGRI